MSSEPADIRTQLERLHDMKSKYRDLKREADEARKAYEIFQAELYGQMQDAGLLSVKSTNGHSYSTRSTAYASIQDRAKFHEWVRAQGLEDQLLKTREEAAVLNEIVREALENDADLPPGLGWYAREYIAIA